MTERAGKFWLFWLAQLVAYEYHVITRGKETPSSAVYRWCAKHFIVAALIKIVVLVTAKHLAAPGVAKKYDPFFWVADWLRRGK